jgi:diguanylate cyclase (GGDEF)-like protein
MQAALSLSDLIVDRINVGVLVVDREMRVVLWNRFLEIHSGKCASELVGRNLFDSFPELPRRWLERKIRGVIVLKSPGFTSWQQRPYLFRFAHHRPITGGIDHMHHDCSFLPMMDEAGEVQSVCITIMDATDTSILHARLNEALGVIAEQSVRDSLTNIYNRRKLEQELHRECQRACRYKTPLSFAMFDIDHFKRVNDTYGHVAGDAVIRHVAAAASGCLRETDCIGRYGGEEFGVIFPHTGGQAVLVAAERIRTAVASRQVLFDERPIAATISIGVTEASGDAISAEALIRQADTALYAAKSAGRNRVNAFSSSLCPNARNEKPS